MLIKGRNITLYTVTETGRDGFNRPVETEIPVEIENVLIQPTSDEERLDTLNLTGRRAMYTLHIPKGDTHDWTDKKVSFFDKTFRTIGEPLEYMPELTPLAWNKKVRCEIINGQD